ncbi:BOLA class I histocompatibility antigen, alpha chain BL3-7-like [Neoarius graeffei]|uniref:BOLA class I histocompatibility antigen, alpha chain BL3-7-like n=1 Tax=Neoarius graeffei TaxID=443677 RepID=UPI00298C835A|nr:BOLA class I histocompatibility antigen, alpha chain BL3-7-like [Neoarius graeffei]
MSLFLFTFTCFLHVSTGTHVLQYLYTSITHTTNSSDIPETEFSAVGVLDGEQCAFYSSRNRTLIPKAWIKKNGSADYWKSETERMQDNEGAFNKKFGTVLEHLNHSKGVQTLQRMYGCECDDDGTTRRYDLYGYDGEDFMSLDLKTGTWTEAKPQTGIFIKKWNLKGDEAKYWKSYLENDCIEWLNKFVSYGRETLERKVRPEASVFHKHSPPPEVVCHATGFFPKALNITWQKDGEDLIEDVELRETLPNQDGSLQKRSILKVPAEELQKHNYTCVVQHSSLEKDLILEVPKDGGQIGVIIGGVVAVVALVAVVVGMVFWKKRNSGFGPVPPKPSPEGNSSSNNSSNKRETAEEMEMERLDSSDCSEEEHTGLMTHRRELQQHMRTNSWKRTASLLFHNQQQMRSCS